MWVEFEMLSKRHKRKAYSLLQEVCIKNCGSTTTFLEGQRRLTYKSIPFKGRRGLATKEAK